MKAFRLEVRKSLFVAEAARAPHADAARDFVSSVRARRRHATAGHHCWGFVSTAEERCDDDGEPSGTAGRPIITAIRSHAVAAELGAVVVVARWKRGPNLGRGGLIRAYREAALGALAEFGPADEVLSDEIPAGDALVRRAAVIVPFELTHEVFAALRVCGGDTLEHAQELGIGLDAATIRVEVPASAAGLLEATLSHVRDINVQWES
ncbi:IMPACT family member yigZ [Hondaea fermentalgiana]|uniref:IMPACT family member yigZ n=1 Tax=Hondaea fermentalgiana TaxID=2315210 RepID=A0A2R5GFJ8_9STRA|nr:IMPACT family member yigZ [Hondaea fermentalgiana]|eukprot:GBG29657.1 IMPACT family member yigZ [Hondaea fermentalgiana]